MRTLIFFLFPIMLYGQGNIFPGGSGTNIYNASNGLASISLRNSIIARINQSSSIHNFVSNAFIGNGYHNRITTNNPGYASFGYKGDQSFIAGGNDNIISSYNAFIGAGSGNEIGGFDSAIASGTGGLITLGSENSFIGSGEGNRIMGGCDDGFIGTGYQNLIDSPLGGANNVIVGGANCVITNDCLASFIGCGREQRMTRSSFSFLGAGQYNNITNCTASLITGGSYNLISNCNNSAILGGQYNVVRSNDSFVVGSYCTNNTEGSVMLGWKTNVATIGKFGDLTSPSIRSKARTTNILFVVNAPDDSYSGTYLWSADKAAYTNLVGRFIYYYTSGGLWFAGPDTIPGNFVYATANDNLKWPMGRWQDTGAADVTMKTYFDGMVVADRAIINNGIAWLAYAGATNELSWADGTMATDNGHLWIFIFGAWTLIK